MIFSKKNAGKWVASKSGKVIADANQLESLVKKIENRKDKKELRFDKVPSGSFAGSGYGI